MTKGKTEETYFDESIGVEYKVKEISDEEYFDNLDRTISYSLWALLILSATVFISILFWVDTIESIVINYL